MWSRSRSGVGVRVRLALTITPSVVQRRDLVRVGDRSRRRVRSGVRVKP